jgi:hypothetical protein
MVQIESITSIGLPRFIYPWPGPLPTPDGWEVRRTAENVIELRDAAGGLWSRIQVAIELDWVIAAEQLGSVLALYGPLLGVRTPPAAKRYPDVTRQEELLSSRQKGLVAGGLLKWKSSVA